MLLAFIIVYTATLLYLCTIERFRHYASTLGVQGWLLLAIALLQTSEMGIWEKVFVIVETLVLKGIVVPFLLFRIINKLKINKVHQASMPPLYTVAVALMLMGLSMWLTSLIADAEHGGIFFGVAIFGLLVGLLLITVHRRIFSQLIGFLVIENSVFLFSLAVGTHIPMLINIGVMLDILMGILLLSLFITKLGGEGSLDSEELSQLKD